MESKIIEHDFDFIIINRDKFEPNEIFQFRANYIAKNLKNERFDNLIKKSRLLSNIKFYNCRYNDHIMEILHSDLSSGI
jgi:hypothetical protein